jgi:carbamoyl-phosphate synthase large subunit
VVDAIMAGEIDVVVNTPEGSGPRSDGWEIRTAAVATDIPCVTTLAGLAAMVQGIQARVDGGFTTRALQAYHTEVPAAGATERPVGGAPGETAAGGTAS